MDPLPFLALAVFVFGSLQVAACIAWYTARKQPLQGLGVVNARDYIADKKPKKQTRGKK
jgi:hypothetical protein